MKEYLATHRKFAIVAGSGTLLALILLFGVAIPARSSAADALEEAEKIGKLLKSSEGKALSTSARQSLEAEVAGLKGRVEEMQRVMNPPKAEAGADPVLAYGNKLTALEKDLDKAASESSVQVPEKVGFAADVDPEDVSALIPQIELAQRILKAAVASGVRRIDALGSTKSSGDFFGEDLQQAGAVRRTCVVVEVRGPMEALMKLLHTLEQKETLYIIPRAQLTRENGEIPEALLKIAVGSVEVSDAKPTGEKGGEETFIFGR